MIMVDSIKYNRFEIKQKLNDVYNETYTLYRMDQNILNKGLYNEIKQYNNNNIIKYDIDAYKEIIHNTNNKIIKTNNKKIKQSKTNKIININNEEKIKS